MTGMMSDADGAATQVSKSLDEFSVVKLLSITVIVTESKLFVHVSDRMTLRNFGEQCANYSGFMKLNINKVIL